MGMIAECERCKQQERGGTLAKVRVVEGTKTITPSTQLCPACKEELINLVLAFIPMEERERWQEEQQKRN